LILPAGAGAAGVGSIAAVAARLVLGFSANKASANRASSRVLLDRGNASVLGVSVE